MNEQGSFSWDERDICRNRHRGNPESVDAFKRASFSLAAQRLSVLNLIRECPRTMKEIAAILGVQLNTVSGRASELKQQGLVRKTGQRRDGSAVLEPVR